MHGAHTPAMRVRVGGGPINVWRGLPPRCRLRDACVQLLRGELEVDSVAHALVDEAALGLSWRATAAAHSAASGSSSAVTRLGRGMRDVCCISCRYGLGEGEQHARMVRVGE